MSLESPGGGREGGPVRVPLPRRVSERAWHYTSAEGLLGILASQTLWATAPEVLNDVSELTYGLELMDEVWAEMRSAGHLPPASVRFVDYVISSGWIDEVRGSVFVISASSDSDVLNQWRNYASADGFAVGLDLQAAWNLGPYLARAGASGRAFAIPAWSDVIYDEALQRSAIRDMLEFTARNSPGGGDDANSTPPEWNPMSRGPRVLLATLPLTLKHPAFADEREVRFVHNAGPGEVHFRSAVGRIMPYAELHAGVNGLPIFEVVCGPGCRPGTTGVVRRLLDAHGMSGASVRQSSIPFAG